MILAFHTQNGNKNFPMLLLLQSSSPHPNAKLARREPQQSPGNIFTGAPLGNFFLEFSFSK